MADVFSKQKRSQIMSRISGKETRPEILVRKQLFAEGFRFRKNDKRLPGKPDIVLPKYHSVIFIHGCFWHHHSNCSRSKLPASRQEFWAKKIAGNVKRDQKQIKALQNQGWRVFTIWQCKLSRNDSRERVIGALVQQLMNASREIPSTKALR